MKRHVLAALMLLVSCDEEGDPPHAERMSCPPQLALTGSPYTLQCTIDFTSPDHDVHDVDYEATDSGGATWVKSQTPTGLVGVRDGSLVFTMTSSTPPALGALAVKASLFEIDQGQSSNTVTATVNVVAP